MKFYEQLLDVLKKHDVKEIYGVPGDAINPLIEALRKQNDIDFIHVAHEEAGAFAASAQAKLTGKLAVCCGTVGPGAIHLLNGLYDAKKDYAPVLAITGQVAEEEMGLTYHQEVDLHTLFRDVSIFQSTVRTADQMPRIAIEACNAAFNEKGVAILTVPHDIGKQTVKPAEIPPKAVPCHRNLPQQERLEQAADMINKAEKVSLLYGEGCRYCPGELKSLAETLKAPMIHSLKGKDLIAADYPYLAGGLGLLGDRGGVTAADECDVLVVLGSDFPYRDWYPDVPIIRVDRNGRVIGRRMPQDLGVVGDCGEVISGLLELVDEKKNTSHLESVQQAKSRWKKMLDKSASRERSKDIIHPQALARAISDQADENAIFTCDTGSVTVWAARHLNMTGKQRLTLSFNLASMAYAMPAALGAQRAYSDRQIISLSGDGGFNMLMGDFLTAVKYNLPIKVFIFNNGKLGLIKMEQEVEGYPESETDLHNPDYALLAKSFGADGATVTHPQNLEEAVDKALKHPGPYLLDVHTHPDELTLPPKVELSQAWGFSNAKIKEFFGDLTS